MNQRVLQTTLKIFIALFILTISCNNDLHCQHFRLNVFNDITPKFSTTDSTLTYLNNQFLNAEKNRDTITMIKCLVSIGSVYRYDLKFEKAFDNSGKAVYLSGEYDDAYLKARAHEEFGTILHIFIQTEDADAHFKESLRNYQLAYKRNKIDKAELFQPYYYLFIQSFRLKNEERGRAYLDSCKQVLENTDLDKINSVYVNFGEAEYLYSEGRYNKAQKLLLEIEAQLNQLPPKTSGTGHRNFLIIIYNGLARIESTLGHKKEAVAYFEKALSHEVMSNEFIFYQGYVRGNYAALLAEIGDFENAYKQDLADKKIIDQYLNARRIRTRGFLSVSNPYKEELRKKDKELAQQKIALAEKKQEVFMTRVFLAVLIGLVIVIAFIVRTKTQRSKHKKQLQLSNELLEHKNKELTANMLQLIEKEEIIQNLSDHIKQPNQKSNNLSYLKNVENTSGNLWEEFNKRFIELNGNFYDRLQQKVPNLTPLDLKISALLKLNFSGKEMAYLLNMSLNSVNVGRSRLRQKLHLDRETNLTGFINSI